VGGVTVRTAALNVTTLRVIKTARNRYPSYPGDTWLTVSVVAVTRHGDPLSSVRTHIPLDSAGLPLAATPNVAVSRL
jgi:hypothetical protein